MFNGIIKYDFSIGRFLFYDFGEGCYGGVVIFVLRIGVIDEDDGWLLIFVYN